MRGLGAAARRGAHLPSSYASAFSSFSGVGGGGGGAGRGRGRGSGSGPSPFGQPRAPGRPIPDDHGADSFYAPHSIGRGRGEPVVPSSPTVPPFSAFSGAGRGRGSPPPAAEDAPKRPEDASPIYDPERARLGASSSALPRSIPSTGAGRGRGSPLSPPPAAEDTPKQHITKRPEDASPISDPERPRPDASSSAPPSSIPSTGAGLGRVSPLPPLPSSEDAPKQHITKRPEDASFSPLPRSIPSTGAGRGVPRFQQPPADKAPEENRFIRRREAMKAAASSPGAPSTQPKLSAQDALKRALERLGGGEGAGGRGRNRGGRSRDRGRGRGESDDRYMVYLGENADGEKLEKRLGEDKMKILEKAFEEAADNALPHPMEDAYMDACHTNNMIEFEPEYHVNFDNPDIDDKPPMSLEEMLQKVKPLIVAYEGIQNQEEWEEAVKDVMARAPHMKELIDMYSGPDVVTAIQQEQELRRVANTLPENIPSSVNRFTDKMLLSLKNNPGWGFDKKCQFMDKYAREVSNLYK